MSQDNDTIERVARAIYEAEWDGHPAIAWDAVLGSIPRRKQYHGIARAALAAAGAAGPDEGDRQ